MRVPTGQPLDAFGKTIEGNNGAQAVGDNDNRIVAGARFRDQVDEQAGAETKVTAETVTAAGRYQVYRRVAQFAKAPDGIEVEFSIDAKGTVGGFYVRPSAQK